MSQFDYIKEIAKYGLENDQDRLMSSLNELVEYSKKTKKVNFAIQLQSILKESLREQSTSGLTRVGSDKYFKRLEDRDIHDLILEKITSDYSLDNIVAEDNVIREFEHFIEEHANLNLLQKFNLPVSNKLLLHGPSGCGKTLASYVIAGELKKMMVVVNLGAIVSSKLGETSKNLSKIFRKAALEDCIIFIDEFDSLGKVRDYSQDHGEMKRVVNTILQLFDYLPQSSVVIAATNQKDMLDSALTRRFDNIIGFSMPTLDQVKNLVELTINESGFVFDNKNSAASLMEECVGLSYYSIQKTLITALKRSLFKKNDISVKKITKIDTNIWKELILSEKKSLNASV